MNLALGYALRIILLALRIWDVENPNKKTSIGMGAFNLVKKNIFMNTPGFEWIKLDVADDVALGHMIKEYGGKCSIVNGTGLVGVHLYTSFWQMLNGSEKAVFTTMGNFSLLRMIFMALIFLLLEYSTFFALFSTGILSIHIIGIVIFILSTLAHLIGNIWMRRPLWEAFFWYLITPVYTFALIRAGILGKLRGGINWKGTFYSSKELKAGKRFKM